MQSAFTKFGEAFTNTGHVAEDIATRESRLAPYAQAGAEAASALQNRWWQMEYENFQSQFLDGYVAKKRALQEDYLNRHAMADEGVFEGPDGNPVELDMTKAKDRERALRMRTQLEKRFWAVNADQDLELQEAAGKYSGNPLVQDRAFAIQKAAVSVIGTITNPEKTLEAEKAMNDIWWKQQDIRVREMQAKATAAAANQRNRPKSYRDAIKDPNIGPAGIMQWFTSDPDGITVLKTGGAPYLDAEKNRAIAEIIKDNPDINPDPESLEMKAKLDKFRPRIVANAAVDYLTWLDPAMAEQAKQATPHFFEQAMQQKNPPPAIVSDKRMSPDERAKNVDLWKEAAASHFDAYFKNANNDPNIESAFDDLETWLRKAIRGETNEGQLSGITIARGPGTEALANEVLEQVPVAVRDWWARENGSKIAQELNPDEAASARAAAGSGGRWRVRAARAKRRRLLDEERKRHPIL